MTELEGRVPATPQEAEPSGNQPRFAALEGVRALAALAIVWYHVGELGSTQGTLARVGERLIVGVPVFFVVSAFVLYRPFVARRVVGLQGPAIGPFFLRRAARIVPLYWATLTLVWVTSPLLSAQTRDQLFAGVPWWRYYLFLQVYDEASSIMALGPAWSLNVEMVFYLALPLWGTAAAWFFSRRVPVHLEVAVLALIAALGLDWLGDLERSGSYLAKAPPANACYFAVGMALAIISVDLGSDRPMLVSRVVRILAPGSAPVLALVLVVFLLDYGNPYYWELRAAIVVLVLLPAVFDRRPATISRRVLMQRHLQLVGVLSYGVYLFHRQIALGLRLFLWAPMGKYDFIVALVAVTGLTVLAATASYRYLEQPLTRLAGSVSRRTSS